HRAALSAPFPLLVRSASLKSKRRRGVGPGGASRIKMLPKRPEAKEEEGGRRKNRFRFLQRHEASRLGSVK
ncbi:MAG TPA: hypothetical protein PKA16_15120, partial [Ottowia sp.]|uniref:hypothetical protein n=1 Tax=Ottowia sp. TaxID=1898956 RepID=UPI002B976367